MNTKLEMMFKDNRKSTVFKVRTLNDLSSSELSRTRQLVEKTFAPLAPSAPVSPTSQWLNNVDTSLPSVKALLEFAQSIGPHDDENEVYNSRLSVFYDEFEGFVKARREYEKLEARTAPLELKLLNAGDSMARDLVVTLTLPDGIELYTELNYPMRPSEPRPPDKPASVFEKMLQGTLPIQQLSLPTADSAAVITDLQILPNLDENSRDVSFHVKKIQQQGRLVVGKFFVVFPEGQKAKSFSMDYKVFAGAEQLVKTGTLTIQVQGEIV